MIRAHPFWMDRKFGLLRFSRSPSQVYASEKSRAGHRKSVSCIAHVLFLLQLLRIAKPAALSYGETKIAEVVAGSDTLGRAGDRRGIRHLRSTYYNWRNPDGDYEGVKGFCNVDPIERVREFNYVLTPGRDVGLPDDEDDFDFKERFTQLKAEFEAQLWEEANLNALIAESLGRVGI
ncbi:MAG: hypothetical protein Q7J24_03500 [Desulfomicrobium sp.]|nr:hypothetical protein [Desulfomicrobium sp.]